MSKIIKAQDLSEEEEVYLKKDSLGWRVVEPLRNKEGKLILWKVLFGSKRMIFQIIIYMLILLLLYFGMKQIISSYQMIALNPCKYCIDCFRKDVIPINYSLLRG